MYKIDIKVIGLDKIVDKIGNIEAETNMAIDDALKESGRYALSKMQLNTPVDTGNLRRSETFEMKGKTALIGPNLGKAKYAPYVEFGHHTRSGSWVPGQYYVYRTLKEIKPYVTKLFRKAVARYLK